ncbi:MAG: 4Fe-4S cluster-binding domain-containing protein [Clostridiales bacterium]|jgi:sulfatase maturation enzyme AslB (radical SAM superfamily)|nr:4Fe-4S cluster-binding domain-containing protein [Clostridiales bacterium]
MDDIFVSIILTAQCNLQCKYCINNSGKDLIPPDSQISEWSSSEDIIDCLINLSKIKNIHYIKFFGGEPMLKFTLLKEVVEQKEKFSEDSSVKFAFTTNAYDKFDQSMLDFFVYNRIILNISLDGPEEINNASRLAKDRGNCFKNVIKNLELLRKRGFPFALIAVVDDRLTDSKFTINDISDFLYTYSPIYKIEPSYILDRGINNYTGNRMLRFDKLLNQQAVFIDDIFIKIASLDEGNYTYENNVLLTMKNIIYNEHHDFICSAAKSITIFPNKRAYSCYNLISDRFLVSKDISNEDTEILEETLSQKQEILKFSYYPNEYKLIENFGGDYCPLENNFDSFAYLYRKNMIENVKRNLRDIRSGSAEHLSLLNYIDKGFTNRYFYNL